MKTLLIVIAVIIVLFLGVATYNLMVVNPRVIEEIHVDPDGERASKVMLLAFPDGKRIPVNYLREGNTVYVGADGPWWRAFRRDGAPVSMLIKGESLVGWATVELEDQAFVDDVFSRLRPTAPEWLPAWLNGRLVVIELQGNAE